MTLAQLNYFVKVAENGHLTQTAKELLIAQPSLTQAIRKLEEELGFLLFEKNWSWIKITAYALYSAHLHTPEFQMGGVAQEFQHRNVAHHRDVHDPRPSLHRP